MEAAIIFQEQKREALTKRVNKIIGWLHRPDYAVYVNHDTTLHLIKAINLTVWALERSLPPDQWEPFRQEILGARYIILDVFENQTQEMNTYYTCLEEVETALRNYHAYIKVNELVREF
jgi:hypothetical protein